MHPELMAGILAMGREAPMLIAPHGARALLCGVQLIGDAKLAGTATDEVRRQVASAKVSVTEVMSGTVIIPVRGLIEYRLSLWGWFLGGTSIELLSQAIQSAIDDSEVDRIILDIDSPGGQYEGTPELGRQIVSQRDAKEIVAVANPCAASGALWIGTAASKFYVLGSGMAGSIGAVSIHHEFSKMMETDGVTTTVFRNPDGKHRFNPYEALTDEDKVYAQGKIDEVCREFESVIGKHRGMKASQVRESCGSGRMMTAAECAACNLSDGIRTMPQVIGEGKKRSTPSRRVEEPEAFTHNRLAMLRRQQAQGN